VKELGDRAVKELVRAPPRLEDVVVHAAGGHRAEHRVGGSSIAPCAEADEQGPLRVGKQRLGAGQELLTGQVRHPLFRQHEPDWLSGGAPALELDERGHCRTLAGDSIVAAVPPLELAPDSRPDVALVLDDEHDRARAFGGGHGLSVRESRSPPAGRLLGVAERIPRPPLNASATICPCARFGNDEPERRSTVLLIAHCDSPYS
jgi:hypothetical protein